ncbi:polysaccharide deacetylase family protein [Lentisalinibacter salinarum]|uniref:polysaccharide deacetylase family protein n=1 Tax=Lentisalinibacter salinarum TaxID=2992239 RepID=UPI0038705E1B
MRSRGQRTQRCYAVVLLALVSVACNAEDSTATPADPASQAHAVILLYHHVSGDTPPSTSVTPATFEDHLDYLADYTVVPLEAIVSAIEDGVALPPDAVAITFDDAYESVYTEALPRLERRGWPFTVFASTDYIDDDYGGYLSWDQLREIERRGGTVGNHSRAHRHMIRRRPGESAGEWRERVAADIRHAGSRLADELQAPLAYFAYPYGEFDRDLENVVADLGLVAFGQQSGPVGPASDRRHLPRFPVAAAYADLDSLGDKLDSRPLPVKVLAPDSRVLAADAGPPELRVRIPEGPYDRERLNCFVTGQEPARISWQDDEATIRARAPLAPGRSKFNCTVPARDASDVYYWYSYLWIKPRADGSWYPD